MDRLEHAADLLSLHGERFGSEMPAVVAAGSCTIRAVAAIATNRLMKCDAGDRVPYANGYACYDDTSPVPPSEPQPASGPGSETFLKPHDLHHQVTNLFFEPAAR